MSLGVKQLWRVLSNSNGARGLSLIPRECTPALAARAAPTTTTTTRSTLRALHHSPKLPPLSDQQSQPDPDEDEFEAEAEPKVRRQDDAITEVHDSGEYPAPAAEQTPTEPSRASSKPPPREAQEQQAQIRAWNVQDYEYHLSPAKPKRARGPSLVNRLAEFPVRAHPALESVFVRPVTEYPDQYEARGSVRTHMKDNARQKKLLGTRESTNRVDWRATLRNLLQWTPRHLPEQFADTVKVIIPRETATRLLSDSEYSMWDIKSRTGCGMVLYRVGDAGYEVGTEDDDPYLIIDGHHHSVNTAIDEILSVTRKVTIISRTRDTEEVLWDGKVDGEDLSLPAPSVVVSARRIPSSRAPYNVNIRADEFPKPEEWTRKTFEEYVDALIKSHMPSGLASKLYPEHGRHEMAVIQQLVAVFNDESAAPFVSNAAFKMALHYMTRGGETWRPEMLSLFNYAQRGRMLQLDVEVFNILAEAAVKTRSLYRFNWVLYLMATSGYQPNLRTWILALRMFEAEEVKRYVLQAMNDRGLFNAHGTPRMIANEMAPHDAYRAVQLRWDVPTFLAKQDELYGGGGERNWVSIDVINKIIHVFGSYSKFAEIRELLDLIFTGKKLVAYPDQVTVNTILAHCKAQKKLDLAVEFIQLFERYNAVSSNSSSSEKPRPPLKLDTMACDMLFDMALWQKKPHVLSTIWRYAHLVNATSSDMRRRGIAMMAMDETELKKEKLVRRLKLGDEERVQFLRNLLLGEFIQANGGEETWGKVMAGMAKGEQERQREMEEMAAAERDGEMPTSLGDWFQSQLSDESNSTITPSATSSTSPPLPSESSPSNPSEFTPNPNVPKLQGPEEPPTRWGALYGSFRRWSFATQFLHLDPSGSIGSLLVQALDRDRELHLALRDPELGFDIKELMTPIQIPTKPRTEPAFEEVGKLFKYTSTRRELLERRASAAAGGMTTKREREVSARKERRKSGRDVGDADAKVGEVQEAIRRQALDKWFGGGGGGFAAKNNANVVLEEAATTAGVVAKTKPSYSSSRSKKVTAKNDEEKKAAISSSSRTPNKPTETPVPAEAQKTLPPPPTTTPPTQQTPTKSSSSNQEIKTKEEKAGGVEPPLSKTALSALSALSSSEKKTKAKKEKRVKWKDLADL